MPGAGDNESDAESEEEEELSPAEIRMNEAMGQLEDIAMDMRLLQVGAYDGHDGDLVSEGGVGVRMGILCQREVCRTGSGGVDLEVWIWRCGTSGHYLSSQQILN